MRHHRLATLIALTLIAGAAQAAPWTYRGSLADGGKPANGHYDIRLTLLDTGGKRTLIGPITFDDVVVTNGNFAVDVDFGVDLSNATSMKLKTEVGEHGANFVALGDPSAFDPKSTLAGVCWDTQGNAGTNPATEFLGTTDNQPLIFRVGNSRSLLLDTGLNSIGGSASNIYSTFNFSQTIGGGGSDAGNCGVGGNEPCRNSTIGDFATIGGGLANTAAGYATVAGGQANLVTSQFAAVGGGFANSVSQNYATIAGGRENDVYGVNAFIGGGLSNEVKGQDGAIAGGNNNYVDTQYGAVGGGGGNNVFGMGGTVGGGFQNNVAGNFGAIAGGRSNCAGGYASFAGGLNGKIRAANAGGSGSCATGSGDADGDEGTFVWSDSSSVNDFVSSGPNQFAVRATGGLRWAGTGVNSTTSPAFAHQVNTATNTCDGGSGANSRTYVNHPLLNFNPNAIIVITPNYGTRTTGTTAPLDKTFGVYYNDTTSVGCPSGRWVIYQMSNTASPINNGARFNIWFVIP